MSTKKRDMKSFTKEVAKGAAKELGKFAGATAVGVVTELASILTLANTSSKKNSCHSNPAQPGQPVTNKGFSRLKANPKRKLKLPGTRKGLRNYAGGRARSTTFK